MPLASPSLLLKPSLAPTLPGHANIKLEGNKQGRNVVEERPNRSREWLCNAQEQAACTPHWNAHTTQTKNKRGGCEIEGETHAQRTGHGRNARLKLRITKFGFHLPKHHPTTILR